MRKIYSLLLLGGLLLLGAGNVWANYDWYDCSMSIGGQTALNFANWSKSGDSPTDLGFLTDMTISSIAFKTWDDGNDRGGANMYFRIWDGGASPVGEDQDLWLGSATRITGDHDFSISWTTGLDLASAVSLTLVPGKTYYIDMWAKTYGTSGDHWFNGTGDNYHVKFVYAGSKTVTIGEKGWTTFCCSWPLDLSDMDPSTGTVTAYYASAANATLNTVTMTSTTATIKEGVGVMLKGTPSATITISGAVEGSLISGNLLVGCTEALNITTSTPNYSKFYVLVNGSTAAEFQNIGAYVLNEGYDPRTLTIPAGKAYLDLHDVTGFAPSVIRIVDEESGATNIEAIEASEDAVKFIQNGKLYIKKNNVVYDMMGAIVK